jgi:putative ABC transport system ATP-binding protein
MKTIIQAENIVRSFGKGSAKTKVLKGISLNVKTGELVAITGKSGSGKSTLLYQLSLLDIPTEGKIIIKGTDTHTLTQSEATEFRLHNLGYVFQDYALLPSLTAADNVMMPLLMQGYSIKKAEKRALDSLARVGLANRYNYIPSKLSGGQQQRVSIARAIAHKPEIIFADEPTANLDSETTNMVLKELLKLNKQGQTIVLVTHEKSYAKKADQRLNMVDGQIETSSLYNKNRLHIAHTGLY